MKRRELLVIFGAAAIAWPLGVQAQQQAKVPRVGFVAMPNAPPLSIPADPVRLPEACGNRLVEGDNLLTEYRFADGKAERLSNMVAELLELKPDVLVVAGTWPSGRRGRPPREFRS